MLVDDGYMIEIGSYLAGLEQDVECELRRRGHASPGEGQRQDWVLTFHKIELTGDDAFRSVTQIVDRIEASLADQ